MKESNKVVSLTGSAPERGAAGGLDFGPRAAGRLPAAVLAVRDRARTLLLDQVKAVFAKVDDSLFAMAEKAHGQEEQDGLFQALRLLRVERRKVADRFAASLDQGFQLDARETGKEEDPFAAENLSLVHNDDLEQLVAADTMVANAKRDFAEPVTELSMRFDTLLPVKIYDKNNPLGPDAICDAFVEAVRPLELHIRARLTLLKKFEQVVMLQLKSLYDICNQQLVEHGVLPALREQRRIEKQRTAQRPSSPGAGGTGGAAGPGVAGGQMPAGGSGNWAPGLVPLSTGLAPMQASDLLTHLGALQSSLPQEMGGEGVQLINVGSLLQERLVQANASASLAKVDSDIIKLVEMLFSFILEDRNLAEPIKSQLTRLQLPLLKVAIADKSFFSKGGHPARKLLNELAEAATGWQASDSYESDPLYREVSQVVARVLAEFDQDVNIFALLLESFRQFIARERKRAEMLERRIVDEADGRARTQAARARVAAVMDALTAERDLPPVVQDWLGKVWSNMLFLTCVKDGTESEAWSRDVRTARDLVWSVQAPMPESRQQLLGLLPALQERLRVGVEAVSLNPFEGRRLFAELKEIYRERFALAQQLSQERSRTAREEAVEELRQEVEQSAPPEPAVDIPQMEELEQAVAEVEVKAEATGVEGLAEMREDDPHWQQTFRLAQGSWFELKRSEDERFRCRLAAVIKDIDQFIFVNRNGAKVAEFSRLELAHALRGARLMPLDDGALFERALQSVIGNVRKKRNEMS